MSCQNKPAFGDVVHVRVRCVSQHGNGIMVVPAHWRKDAWLSSKAFNIDAPDVLQVEPRPLAVGDRVRYACNGATYTIGAALEDGRLYWLRGHPKDNGFIADARDCKRID